MSASNSRVLCVESYLESCAMVSRLLFIEKYDFEFTITHSPTRALALSGERAFDLYIVKSRLPEMTGVEFCRRLRKTGAMPPILFLTGKNRASEWRAARAAGVSEILILPIGAEKLTAKVKALLDNAPRGLPPPPSASKNGTPFASSFR